MQLPIKVSLIVLEGDDQGQTFELEKKRTVIGRQRADILFKDKKISSTHLAIEIDGKDVFVEDLNSTNGTFLNDQKISREKLKNMDELTVGYTRVRLHIFENLNYFKKLNLKQGQEKKGSAKVDIGAMISEELEKFSRWDIADNEDKEEDKRATQPPKQKLMVELIEGPEKGKRVFIDKASNTIGRGKADIRIKDPDISRNHALIECYGRNDFFIVDQASTNGTYLNNKRISKARLKDGDKVQLGGSIFIFIAENG